MSNTKKIVCAVIAVIALLFALALGGFSVARWALHDDAQDIQGTWKVEGSETTIVINETEIRMTSDMIFTYKLDPVSKNITEKLDTKQGTSHYIFSADRNELILCDFEFDAPSSFFFDGMNLIQAFFTGAYSDSSAPLVDSSVSSSTFTRLTRVTS